MPNVFDSVSVTDPGSGKRYVGDGFYVQTGARFGATDSTPVTVYGPEGDEAASGYLTNACDIRPVGPDPEHGVLLWGEVVKTPAEGLKAASWDVLVNASDPITLETKWTATISKDAAQDQTCSAVDLDKAALTAGDEYLAINDTTVRISDGTVRTYDGWAVPFGKNVITFPEGTCANCLNNATSWKVYSPATGAAVFTTTGHHLAGEFSETQAQGIHYPASVASDAAGDTVYYHEAGNSWNDTVDEVFAVSTADGTVRWSLEPGEKGRTDFTLDPSTGVLVITTPTTDKAGYPADRARGFDAATGKQLWDVTGFNPCSALNGTVVGVANEQLTSLDVRTGKQLSYTAEFSSCGVGMGEYMFAKTSTPSGIGGEDVLVRVHPAAGARSTQSPATEE